MINITKDSDNNLHIEKTEKDGEKALINVIISQENEDEVNVLLSIDEAKNLVKSLVDLI